ncbi:site-specific recombinase XerD [Sinobacterium caligoides]|uniref:Site-specific recombinase XerD n=1 Tax=Sinobacterium caligoides TaxID=933926 RepID=A0A3N2DXP4_9GAMM|nr:site-specific integrase [Sinobacterium caligoides]ROS04578.1 site-specific recombinase XerD [Sinobacterium caligoides]
MPKIVSNKSVSRSPKEDSKVLVAGYMEAATAENTRRGYRSDVRVYEKWGGLLPASQNMLIEFLADMAQQRQMSTLRRYLASISKWHQLQGFVDPARSTQVKTLMRGIAKRHNRQARQAKPIAIAELEKIDGYLSLLAANHLDEMIDERTRKKERLVALRDRAMLLLGFWRAMRGAELLSVQIEDIKVIDGQGAEIYLRSSKADREGRGVTHRLPCLDALCPIEAIKAWLCESQLTSGPLFRSINRWGGVAGSAMGVNSLAPWMRGLLIKAGVADSESYSAHSMRRGFATHAVSCGTDLKELMSYVGWKDVSSAMRYIDHEASLQSLLPARLQR